MTGQRHMISVLVVGLLVALGVAALGSGDEDGERIATGSGIVARAGGTPVVEALPEVADPSTTTTSVVAPAPGPTTTLRRPVATGAPATMAPATTTTAPPAIVTTSTTAPAPLAAASVAPTTSTTAAPTTTTTVDPCRNGSDATCGPFRFHPQPGADRPMTVNVSVEPAPVAGQPVVFHMTLSDPDGVSYDGTNFNFGNSGIAGSTPEACAKFGPWDPPARDPASATKTLDVTHTYFEAGTYTATFRFDAGPFDCVDSVTGRGDRPYASSATGTVTVQVSPVS